jgi:hypothetical protein
VKDDWQSRLKRELAQAGAGPSEISGLMPLAAGLRKIGSAEPAGAAKRSRPKRWAGMLRPALPAASGAVLGMAVVIFSQSAAPTSWLYPVQRLSDRGAVMLHPEYRATVMMRRARQVNELVASGAPAASIRTTLASYDNEAASYKSMSHSNYAAFEYCQTNLRQAEAGASGSVRQSIRSSLDSLNTT